MRAFTLIELLVVLVVVGLLVGLTLPAFTQIAKSNSVVLAGRLVEDQMTLARQEATTVNRDMEVRFIQTQADPDLPGGYRALQVWKVDHEEGTAVAFSRLVTLPDGIAIDDRAALSPILGSDGVVQGSASFGRYGNRSYTGFRIRPNGRLLSSITPANNFVTIAAQTDQALPPVNFYTIRINPITGRTKVYR